MQTRRIFLKSSALALFGAGALPTWLSRAVYANENPRPRNRVLVAVFQRGAVDGLNVVVPHGEKRYYELRPSIAIPRPDGTLDSAVDLDGMFGLHPALAPLKRIYDSQNLAIVEAVGSPDPTRSHFDAQDYMESGTPGVKSTRDGWINRALPRADIKASPMRAVSLGTDLPRSLRGRNDALAISSLNGFQVQDPRGAQAFEEMYDSTIDSVFRRTGREIFEAVRILQSIEKQNREPENGAEYPSGRFAQSMRQIARLIKSGVGLEVAFADVGGWDTHVNEAGATPTAGTLARNLTEFGGALAAFYRDLGDRMEDVAIVTMSEFGRTAKENGNRGTDHGHANVMLVMGGAVRGGKVYGEWPGLEREQLYEARDLKLTTDFRDILGELIANHLGNTNLGSVFPGYDQPRFRGLFGS